ncbi:MULTISPECIES: lipid kinase [unclassified Pantoea]|uniref:lipid kinase n=1 Tax=unclassified Pantoea TaxID=2630326 RepID=UPI001232A775|nr:MULTISPECIES: lipid kinase [unclassified Pantoea]KAA5973519.1 lipid kinase [Pantoea sp. M_6]KAA5980808.1 lipid kinase [Pantoea sp. M_8]KAA5994490.1 lipid kinase [Pantoea sp. M_10]KAA5995989.1 lipid kinase [Pantoea sp. M_5]
MSHPLKTALLLINPRSRKGRAAASRARTLLTQAGITLLQPAEEESRSYRELIAAYAPRIDAVIVGGGDGTLNAAAPGVMQTGLPLGILPLGTANDFARTLGIPATLEQAVQIITDGQLRAVDLGEVNQHLFLNVSSIGFSAELARNLTAESKKRWGVGGYALAALRLLRQSRPFSATLIHEEQRMPIRTVQVSVGNGRFYGGGMTVEARAAPDDGLLDVYSLEVRHSWQLIALLPFLRRGTQGRWRNVRTFSTTALTIETRRPHYINADGEIIGQTPAHFRLIAGAIQVYAPAGPTAE